MAPLELSQGFFHGGVYFLINCCEGKWCRRDNNYLLQELKIYERCVNHGQKASA